MPAKWLLCNVGQSDRIQALSYAIQEIGRPVEILSLKDTYALAETPSDEKDCVVFRGCINLSILLRQTHPNWFGNWHASKIFQCSHYYSYWGKYITQRRYAMFSLSEILRNWDWLFETFGKDDQLFIRPNSGDKEFNGEIVHKKNIDAWKFNAIETKNVLIDELAVVSTPVHIQKEVRLIIVNRKVVAGSSYRIDGMILYEALETQSDAQRIIDFAEKVLIDLSPPKLPPVHCLDIAVDGENLSVLEVGCFCCCGLYDCDLHKIALAVSVAAEHGYNGG